MATQAQQDMATTILTTTGAVDMIAGGRENVDRIAQEWVDAGFTADDAPAWWEAGGFDAARTAYLRDMGLTPELAGEDHPTRDCTWAYGYSNGDISDLEVSDFFEADIES